jgi:rod shape-determining protein MreC
VRNLLDFLQKYSYWFLFVLLEVVCAILLFRYNGYQASVYLSSANRVMGSVYECSNAVTSYFHLKTENGELLERTLQLERELNAWKTAYRRAVQDSLQTFAPDSLLDGRYALVRGEVVNNSLRHTDNYLTLNVGSADGICNESGVVGPNGIVGIVYLIGTHHSIVIPVLNSKSSISCKIKGTDYFGYLKWDGVDSRFAYLMDMPRHSACQKGDTIVSSGFTTLFPAGLPVGRVVKVEDSDDGLSYRLKIQLATDFGALHDVCVLTRKGDDEQMELEQQLKEEE